MFKQIFTLARGRSEDAAQRFMDANALTILRQQLRDTAAGVLKTRKALAVVMAYADREKVALEKLEAQIKDLETRALAALEQDREDLALEASQAIADLEADAKTTQHTIETYALQITRLRSILRQAETQLAELKRGQRVAEANEKTLSLRGAVPSLLTNDLTDASATLARLQERQDHADATIAAMAELSAEVNADSISDRLAAAGCGAAKRSDAASVLARLKATPKA